MGTDSAAIGLVLVQLLLWWARLPLRVGYWLFYEAWLPKTHSVFEAQAAWRTLLPAADVGAMGY